MTLHEAMVEALELDGRPMSPSALAAAVNRLGHYARGDGAPVPSNQISARARNYPHLFTRGDGLIGLRSGPADVRVRTGVTKLKAQTPVSAASTPLGVDAVKGSFAPISTLPFRDIGTLSHLAKHGLPRLDWLGSCGVYALVLPSDYKPEFLGRDAALAAGNVLSPWSVARLELMWVPDTRIAYIGLAGSRSPRSLRKRLTDLLNHRAGKTTDNGPHKGGEIIWQLADTDSVMVRAMPTDDPPAPRDAERQLLSAFVRLYDVLPFANRQG